MTIYYLDFSGKRHWGKNIDSKSLLESFERCPQKGDVVFIHSTDFIPISQIPLEGKLNSDNGEYKKYRKPLETIIAAWEENGKIGDGESDILVVSGGTILTDTQELICDILKNHNQEKIYFHDMAVEHNCDPNTIFGDFIGKYNENAIRPSMFFNRNNQTLLAAFRILLQDYIVGVTDAKDLPVKLKDVKQMISKTIFGEEYWSPILVDGKIASGLIAHSEGKLKQVISLLQNHDFQKEVPVKYLESYRTDWFNGLKNEEEAGYA